MIEARRLLADGQRWVKRLEQDLAERLATRPELEAPLAAEYAAAREGGRTAQGWGEWRGDLLTQVAVHWVLGAVFVRFLEDNALVAERWLAGPGLGLDEARSRRERFFAATPAATDREYLLAAFRAVAAYPATAALFDERHNPLFRLGPTADGARELVEVWQRVSPGGELVHDFADAALDTRFLGDLYQDLSEAARKRYALLQTPLFVEEFLLDRTLEPAIAERGLAAVSVIDPACGSGHFLLGAFARLVARWEEAAPRENERERVRRALEQIAGVDLNPFAVAIARFRLVVAALRASELTRLVDAPAFPLQLATGDSLLHGPRPGMISGTERSLFEPDPLAHVYESEDAPTLARLLGRRYAVVVGNPPYVTPKDARLNERYRDRFPASCRGKYSLAVPFTERFFDLAEGGQGPDGYGAGWVGMITANSFMKREFGKKLIEGVLARLDLTHVIDTSGAYLPGHGTPTVILLGRNRRPATGRVRAVMGIRGEPGTPEDPARGLVWTAIGEQVDDVGSTSEWVSVVDLERKVLERHPWSLGGGGAAELKERVERGGEAELGGEVDSIGFASFTGTDDAFVAPPEALRRKRVAPEFIRSFVYGETLRDWAHHPDLAALTPYGPDLEAVPYQGGEGWAQFLWPFRALIGQVISFGGKTRLALGEPWWTWYRWVPEKYRTPLTISFAFVATHNHFVLDRGGKVFKQTAPVIKLPAGATEEQHLGLIGLLNSSAACFWMKQVFFAKGGDQVGNEGARVSRTLWEERFEHDGTKLLKFPLPSTRPVELARELDRLARAMAAVSPSSLFSSPTQLPSSSSSSPHTLPPDRAALASAQATWEGLGRRMIALQEELDWACYRLYGLISQADALELPDPTTHPDLPELALGERAFEIALARRVAAGEVETQWFARHGSTPRTDLPAHWTAAYRDLVQRRLAAIAEDPALELLERPEYKRRWNREPWADAARAAQRAWLLDRLESPHYWPQPRLTSTAALADRVRRDADFGAVAALYRGRDDYDLTALLTELVSDEGVPFLAAWRYTDSGLAKRAEWEETWRRQRREDELDARAALPSDHPDHLGPAELAAAKAAEVGDLPVPPRYAAKDFRKPATWRLRGKLDVAKERFLLYPGLERGTDRTPVLGWAGWTVPEQAEALGHALEDGKTREAWSADRLLPLLAGLAELLPWLEMWHNDPDPTLQNLRLADFYRAMIQEDLRALGLAEEQLKAWRPGR